MTNREQILQEINKDAFRKNLSRYTWQAYNSLPVLAAPHILDAGCGTGVPTIELAILSKARITAVDIDSSRLKQLKAKIKALKLDRQIHVRRARLTRLPFKKESFDVIWSEGAIGAIGFACGLKAWYPLLKPHGYLVVHDDKEDAETKLQTIAASRYLLLKSIEISSDIWRDEYFKPLTERLNYLHKKYEKSVVNREILCEEGCEVELFNRHPQKFASVFYIMQKVPG